MPAAVWRTSPARSMSLWLTIWASAGLSLRTGRKARDQRMAGALRWSPPAGNRGNPVAPPTQQRQKSNLDQFRTVTALLPRPTHPRPDELTLGSWVRRCEPRLGTRIAATLQGG